MLFNCLILSVKLLNDEAQEESFMKFPYNISSDLHCNKENKQSRLVFVTAILIICDVLEFKLVTALEYCYIVFKLVVKMY